MGLDTHVFTWWGYIVDTSLGKYESLEKNVDSLKQIQLACPKIFCILREIQKLWHTTLAVNTAPCCAMIIQHTSCGVVVIQCHGSPYNRYISLDSWIDDNSPTQYGFIWVYNPSLSNSTEQVRALSQGVWTPLQVYSPTPSQNHTSNHQEKNPWYSNGAEESIFQIDTNRCPTWTMPIWWFP